jgi:hypothetical protein
LNRHLVEAAFQQGTGNGCFRRLVTGLDGVLVSDVGKPFEVQGNRRAGGLMRTALGASYILMDRVWQLEHETLHDTPNFVFAPITEIVEPAEDSAALHPEIQRQTSYIRTDLDRFSPLEISTLVRHGYCVGRKACRARPELFGNNLPAQAPWDPVSGQRGAALTDGAAVRSDRTSRQPAAVTVGARNLQASSLRRIWSSLLDYRDWASYVYVPILIPILVLVPYLVIKSYERSARYKRLMDSLSQGSPDVEIMSRLLEGPVKPWVGVRAEEVHQLEKPNFKGFEVLQDSRILDLRPWSPKAPEKGDSESLVYKYRRLKVLKKEDHTGTEPLRLTLLATSAQTQVRFPPQQLQPTLRMGAIETAAFGAKTSHLQMSVDFHSVPPGEFVDIIYEHYSTGLFLRRGDNWTTITLFVEADTAEETRWFLMPAAKEYRSYRILRYENGKPETAEAVKVVTEYLADDSTILAFKLIGGKAGFTYEVTWYYK